MHKILLSRIPLHRLSNISIGGALLLSSWGSLRNTITPLGYWCLWGLWAIFTYYIMRPRNLRSYSNSAVISLTLSFSLLITGMLIASIINKDGTSLYQTVKVCVILAFGILTVRLTREINIKHFYHMLYIVIFLSLVTFYLSKILMDSFPILGGVRQGSIFAEAGVFWKAGVFFLPWFLIKGVLDRSRILIVSCATAACLFFTLTDGSRTGTLLVLLMYISLIIILLIKKSFINLCNLFKTTLVTAPLLILLIVFNSALGKFIHNSNWATTNTTVTRSMDLPVIDQPAAIKRIDKGDKARITLLLNGWKQARACFPLGCGFGSTKIDGSLDVAMDVHNAYLAALADFGVLGLAGLLGVLCVSAWPLRNISWRTTFSKDDYYIIAASGSALASCLALALHTFSTEMSEWGFLLIAIGLAWQPVIMQTKRPS